MPAKTGLAAASAAVAGGVLMQVLQRRFLSLLPAFARGASSPAQGGTGVSFCFVTAPSQEVADDLSSKLVSEKLAACVNTIPGIQSRYLWEGKVETDTELLLMIKTRTSLKSELADFVQKHHPYDVPEVICTEVTSGLPAYLQWVAESTKEPRGR